MTPQGQREALLLCPFCGDAMNVKEHSAFHPPATLGKEWCWISTAGEFGGCYELSEADYPAWNTRAALSATPAPGMVCVPADLMALAQAWADTAAANGGSSETYRQKLANCRAAFAAALASQAKGRE